jgi:hypothetical protein
MKTFYLNFLKQNEMIEIKNEEIKRKNILKILDGKEYKVEKEIPLLTESDASKEVLKILGERDDILFYCHFDETGVHKEILKMKNQYFELMDVGSNTEKKKIPNGSS